MVDIFQKSTCFYLLQCIHCSVQKNRRSTIYAQMHQVRTIFWHNRWSGAVPHISNRMKRSNLLKRYKTYSVLGGGRGERFSLRCRQVTRKVPKTVKNLFVRQFCSWDGSFRHGEMKIWLCLYFQHVTRYIGTDFVEESRQKCKDQKRSIFFAKGALIGKSIFQIQRINAVHGRCSSSNVLRDFPPNFTRSIRRRIVLLCLSPERWNRYVVMAERSEQMGWLTRTSALPIRGLRQIAYLLPMWGGIWNGVVFFEGDWYVHRIAVWECFDIGTWTRRIPSHVLTR